MKILFFGVVSGLVMVVAMSHAVAAPNIGIDKDWMGYLRLNPCQDSGSFIVYNEGDGVLEWTIAKNQDWFTVEPSSGSNEPGLANGTVVTISLCEVAEHSVGACQNVAEVVDIKASNLRARVEHRDAELRLNAEVLIA